MVSSSVTSDIPVIFQVASFVGCVHLPQSHRYLCSWGCVLLPPRCNLKSIGYRLPGIRSLAVAMHLEIYWVYIW
ncbi:hypothetical protein [Photorhabdus australis]|uniref:hypothetical protein n=1 Tax=Photorhabdus australis TaxID=286156 RepID=UPI000AAD3D2B